MSDDEITFSDDSFSDDSLSEDFIEEKKPVRIAFEPFLLFGETSAVKVSIEAGF